MPTPTMSTLTMPTPFTNQVAQLLKPYQTAQVQKFFQVLQVPDVPAAAQAPQGCVHRSSLSFALAAVLFARLVLRVPQAQQYVARLAQQHTPLVLDHGALRTVAWPCGALPSGEAAFTRFLSALGYALAGVYPLPKLKMTGRSYAQQDDPQNICQYFVSELHPEQFSERFQTTATRVLGQSTDPLQPQDLANLDMLRRDTWLASAAAQRLLAALLTCFDRQHGPMPWADYQNFFVESAEMAWISTEGNTFNHATDRVAHVESLAQTLRAEGYALKEQVEVSKNGRVRQTALKSTTVERHFLEGTNTVTRVVPGSFFEFISRDRLDASDPDSPLDLSFDSGNATGIFKMTEAKTA
jgi:hypothetical protein